jgi:hypothetical protein
MSLTNYLKLSAVFLSLGILTGCGGSGGSAGNIPGPFSNSSLNGMYAFSFSGANQFGFLAVAGSFAANGMGTITGGTIDINSGNGVVTNTALTGAYRVNSNGQGTAALRTSTGTFDLNFVILADGNALVIRFDTTSSGSGTILLQNSGAFSLNALAGTLVFNIAGADASGAGNPESSAGVLTVDNSGNLLTGVQDTNDDGIVSPNVSLTPANLAMGAPTNGRGTLVIGTRNFVYYVVDANHIKLVEIDPAPALAGDAFRQTGTVLSGSFAFTTSGASTGGNFVSGGVINTDGGGNILNTSAEDVNNGGLVAQNITLSGTYSVLPSGRGTMILNGGTIIFAIYPSSSGVQMIEIDNGAEASGTAIQQTGPFTMGSVQGNYGWNFTGVVQGFTEIDSIAQFAANAGNVTGAADFNDGGQLNPGLALTGTYVVTASGRGTATYQSNLGTQNLIFYVVNSTRVLFLDADITLVAIGEMDHQ